MKTTIRFLTLLLLAFFTPAVRAQGNAFTYQGRLSAAAGLATGSYDLQFVLFDAASGGNAVAGTNTVAPVPVSGGLFTVTLDFGSAAFDSAARWLEIGVRTNGSLAPHAILTPRQALTATPYAIHAGNAALLSGLGTNAFAPATGSSSYVAKAGDTMTGTLNLPANGIIAGGNQLVLSGGNVGIGTESPENKLHVGSGWIQMSRGYGVGADLRTVGGWYRPNLGLALPHTAEYGSLNFLASPSAYAPHFAFRNSLDNSAWMVISDGNVGIGTASPVAKLQVEGSHPQLRLGNPAAGSGVQIDFMDGGVLRQQIGHLTSSFDLQFGTGGTDANGAGISPRMTIDQAGNVGIGTTSPGSKLHVSGSAQDVARFQSSSGTSRISLDPTGAGGRRWVIESTGGSFNIGDATAGADRVFINSSGNVGIGTTAPTAALEVAGAIRTTRAGTPGQYITQFADASGSHIRASAASGAISLGVTGDYLSVLEGGNVGIGTTTPQARLDVAGTVALNGTTIIDAVGNWVGNPTGLQGPPGPKGDTGATGATGPQGPSGSKGADGKTVLNGAGVPSSSTGVNGDFYINTSAHSIYGPKAGGIWGSATSLVGPQGPAGPAVSTVANCGSGSDSCNSICNGSSRVVSRNENTLGCSVTSDTGSCGYSTIANVRGYCCVCRP